KQFFMNVLGIDQETSDATACRMEHVVPKLVFTRLLQFIKYVHTEDSCGVDVAAGFQAFRAVDDEAPSLTRSLEEYFEGTGFDTEEVS
ncbi:MAG TPA: iron dependent repressor, metal binding and dimerization domain protein, partial [Magnetospirillaceae bacterium]|nr:iron dependent repressor, metal binding and dimerization domain protein [Magnetospirillaceae bacterium]